MSRIIQLAVPENVIRAIGVSDSELPDRALEAIVAQLYQAGRFSHAEVAEALHLTSMETDAFLKRARAYRPLESEDYRHDIEVLRDLT